MEAAAADRPSAMMPFDPQHFHNEAIKLNNIEVIFGVPDSSLSGLLSYFAANKSEPQHVLGSESRLSKPLHSWLL